MEITEAMIAWNPSTDEIEVGPWPDRRGWSRGYRNTSGACYMFIHKLPPDLQLTQMFVNFNTIVVRDEVVVKAVHREFLKIAEYRQHISPDMEGSETDFSIFI